MSGSFVLTIPAPSLDEPTPQQIRTVSFATRIWNKVGEVVVAKIQPDGRVAIACCADGTWDIALIERDGTVPAWQ